MSEESKSAEGDYVMMGGVSGGKGGKKGGGGGGNPLMLDDPNLTQEEKDHRMAIALQQQENTVAYAQHKKRQEDAQKAQFNRSARSGTFTKLAAIRDKDLGMLSVPGEYTSDYAYHKDMDGSGGVSGPPKGAGPQEVADFQFAARLQKVEQVDAGTVRAMTQIVTKEVEGDSAQARRTERSNYHINRKGRGDR